MFSRLMHWFERFFVFLSTLVVVLWRRCPLFPTTVRIKARLRRLSMFPRNLASTNPRLVAS